LEKRAGLSFPAQSAGMNLLVELGVAQELTGKKRNRIYSYERYLRILSEALSHSDRNGAL